MAAAFVFSSLGAVAEYAFVTKFSDFERGKVKIVRHIQCICRTIFTKPEPKYENCSRNGIWQQPPRARRNKQLLPLYYDFNFDFYFGSKFNFDEMFAFLLYMLAVFLEVDRVGFNFATNSF